MPGFPYTSWIALVSIIVIIISMPFISGQTSGLIAGVVMTVLFAVIYLIMKYSGKTEENIPDTLNRQRLKSQYAHEFSEELSEQKKWKSGKRRNESEMTCKDKKADDMDDEMDQDDYE
jgi:amino acid permease